MNIQGCDNREKQIDQKIENVGINRESRDRYYKKRTGG